MTLREFRKSRGSDMSLRYNDADVRAANLLLDASRKAVAEMAETSRATDSLGKITLASLDATGRAWVRKMCECLDLLMADSGSLESLQIKETASGPPPPGGNRGSCADIAKTIKQSGDQTVKDVRSSDSNAAKPTNGEQQTAPHGGMSVTDESKRKDKQFAHKQAQADAARIKKSGTLTTEDRHLVNSRLSFFEEDAWTAYSRVIKPVLLEVAREEIDMPPQWAFALDTRKQEDKRYAQSEAQKDAARIQKTGTLSADVRQEINAKLEFFQGAAWDVYQQEIKPSLMHVTEDDARRRKEAEVTKREDEEAEAEKRRQDEKRNYEGTAAYYESTRQAQLDLLAKRRAEIAKQTPNMTDDEIDSRWNDWKEAFVSAASAHGHGLKTEQLFIIWKRYWADRVNTADKMVVQIARGESIYARGSREQEQYEQEFAFSSWILSHVIEAHTVLNLADGQGKELTLEELNKHTIKAAGFHDNLVQATGMIVPRGLRPSGPPKQPTSGAPKPPAKPPDTIVSHPPPMPPRPPVTATGGGSSPNKTIVSHPPPMPRRMPGPTVSNVPTGGGSATANQTAASGAAGAGAGAGEMKTVGRWMGRAEYDAMEKSGKVQERSGGYTNVLYPPDPSAYKAAPSGWVYVEFQVPASSLKPKSAGQALIPGPNSPYGRLAVKQGQPRPEMPQATNIKIKIEE
jgi:hypothetical protein